MTTSSIHFKRVDPFFCEKHNSRNTEKQPTYLLDTDLRKSNDFVKLTDITVLHNEQLEIRKNNRCRGKAPELRDSCWEAVVNLEGRHSLEDMQPVLKLLQEKYHLTPTSVAIHRDEGYKDKDGTVKYNYHAHIPCYTVYQGKSVMRTIGKKQLSDMQTEVADLLGMQRGQINSTAKRLEQSEYRRLAKVKQELERAEQKQKQAEAVLSQVQPVLQNSVNEKEQLNSTVKKLQDKILSLKEQKAIVEAERKKYKDEGDHIASEYRKLQDLNKTLHTQEELDNALAALRKDYEERLAKEAEKINTLNSTVKNFETKEKDLKAQLEAEKNNIKTETVTKTVLRDYTEAEINNLPKVVELNSTVKDLKAQRDYFKKSYNAELEIHQQLQEKLETKPKEVIKTVEKIVEKSIQVEVPRQLTASEIEELPRVQELKKQNTELIKFNSTVLQVIQAMYSDFDLEHPIDSLKKIYNNWKNRTQKSSVIAPKRSITNENTIQRTEVLPSTQNRAMSILEQNTTEQKKYRIMFGADECFMTAQDIHNWLTDYPEERDIIAKQLSEEDRAEVFGKPQQKQSLFSRVKHSLER